MTSSQHLTHLLNRCALGDHHAFEILYRETSAQLFGLATNIVKEPDLASKILEESYVRIWEQADHFQASRMPPVTWMTAIVRYQSMDLARKSVNPPLTRESTQALSALTGSTDQPNQALHNCISHLGETQCRAMKLAYFYGMTYEDIARCLGKSGSKIKSSLRKDLLRLKKCLD